MAANAFTQAINDGMAFSLETVGENIGYQGSAYRAVVNSVESSSKLDEGGFMHDRNCVVIVRRSDFPTAPTAGQKLTVDGSELRITKVDRDTVSYELTCVSANT